MLSDFQGTLLEAFGELSWEPLDEPDRKDGEDWVGTFLALSIVVRWNHGDLSTQSARFTNQVAWVISVSLCDADLFFCEGEGKPPFVYALLSIRHRLREARASLSELS